jgi:hypothetical protein
MPTIGTQHVILMGRLGAADLTDGYDVGHEKDTTVLYNASENSSLLLNTPRKV